MINHKTGLRKKGSLVIWLILASLVIVAGALILLIKGKISKNRIGKPSIVVSQHYGRVEAVMVKPGDLVEPGKALCNYIVTDNKGKGGDNTVEEDVFEVTVRDVKGQRFEDSVELPGITTPITECHISAQVGGEIIDVHVDDGRPVKKGQLLISIEKKDYEIALDRAQAMYDLARLSYERVRKLKKQNAVSTAEHDKAYSDFRSAKSALESSKLALSRCEIKSPIDGILDRRFIEVGEMIAPGKEVAVVIDISRMKIEIGIPEQDVSLVRNLENIDFTVPSLDNRLFKGKVDHLSFSTTQVAKVYPLEIHLDNPEIELLPGMVVKARVIRKVYDNAVLLPIFSVVPGDNEYFTFVNNSGRAEKRIIELGTFQETSVHIKSGLKPGDMVIDKGLRLIAPGSKLHVVE